MPDFTNDANNIARLTVTPTGSGGAAIDSNFGTISTLITTNHTAATNAATAAATAETTATSAATTATSAATAAASAATAAASAQSTANSATTSATTANTAAAAAQTTADAALPLAGGTMSGAIDMAGGNLNLDSGTLNFGSGGSIVDDGSGGFNYTGRSAFQAINLNSAGNMFLRSNSIAMNDGSGSGGGTINLDSGTINFDLSSSVVADGSGNLTFSATSITGPFADPTALHAANNLSDVANATTALANLGVSKLMIGGAVVVTNPKMISTAGMTLTSGSDTTLYTVPTGRSAMIVGVTYSNMTSGSSAFMFSKIGVSGTNYTISESVPVAAGAFFSSTGAAAGATIVGASTTSSPLVPTIVFAAGESFVVNTTQTGCFAYAQIIEFDATNALKTAKVLAPTTNAISTVYTVPSGKSAMLIDSYGCLAIGAKLFTSATTTGFTFNWHHVTSSGSNATANQITPSTSIGTNNRSGGPYFGSLASGESLQLNITTGTSTAGTMAWVNVIEL